MSTKTNLLTPVGRLVQGSLYNGSTVDMDGRPLVYKSGAQAGQPRTNYWFALAIQKGNESHWAQTQWGQLIWDVGQKSFPNGQANAPTFAWKIVDGDSTLPNRENKRPCDAEGFPGHWIMKFSGSFAPSIYNKDGSIQLTEPNAVQPGDYIQVYCAIDGNDSNQTPGIYLNPNMIALIAIGERIILGMDAKEVGFGQAELPANAKLQTNTSVFNSQTTPPGIPANAQPFPQTPMPTPNMNATNLPPAYPQILTPPLPTAMPAPVSPVAPVKTLTEKANGNSYDQLIAAGWTDALLIQHGLMIG